MGKGSLETTNILPLCLITTANNEILYGYGRHIYWVF